MAKKKAKRKAHGKRSVKKIPVRQDSKKIAFDERPNQEQHPLNGALQEL